MGKGGDDSGFWLGLFAAGAAAYLISKATRTQCPVCQGGISRGTISCPHCGVRLQWQT